MVKITFDRILKGIKNPHKAIHLLLFQIKLGKVSNKGERLIIEELDTTKNSRDLPTLAHIKRYEWVSNYIANLRCLDNGCGSGYGTYYLATHGVESIVGTDISSDAIKFAQRHYRVANLTFKIMNSCELKFHSSIFDAIVSFDVLEHIKGTEQERFISETVRVLKPGGKLYIGCPNKNSMESMRLMGIIGKNPYHHKELTKREFEQLLQKYYKDVKILGQDIQINGIRQKEKFYKHRSNLSYENLIIVKDNQEFCHGLLAICKKS